MKKKLKPKCLICKKKTSLFFIKKKQPTKIYPAPSSVKFKKKDLKIFICFHCRHLFQHPLPTKKQIKSYYSEEQTYYTSLMQNPQLGENKEKEKINFIKNIISEVPYKPSLVEIGGFDGYLIYKLKKLLKNSLLIEPNSKGVKIAKKYKIKSLNKYLDKIISKKLKGQFDIVVSRHVIEHISNLKEFVNQMCLLLKPNGTLIVETPSQNTIIQKKLTRVFILQHIHYFSEYSLIKIFQKLKFHKTKTLKENSLIIAFKNKPRDSSKSLTKKIKFNKFSDYKRNIKNYEKNLNNKIKNLNRIIKKEPKKNIWIYGASAQINDLFTVYNFKKNLIKGIIDGDRKKVKYRIPVCKDIPIYFLKKLKKVRNDTIIIATNSKDDALKTLNKYHHKGIRHVL